MKNINWLIVILLIAVSCKTTKNKMIPNDNYTVEVEAIQNMMPSSDGTSRSMYAIITITANSDYVQQWKFENAVLQSEEKSFTLSQFDHDSFFEKGQKNITTNLRGIPEDIEGDFDLEINLKSKSGEQLQVSQKNIQVSTVH